MSPNIFQMFLFSVVPDFHVDKNKQIDYIILVLIIGSKKTILYFYISRLSNFSANLEVKKIMTLTQIEQSIDIMSYDELLYLLEKLVSTLRQKSSSKILTSQKVFEQQIAKMAEDPDVQRELVEINREFAMTELDGLEKI
ncbi:MAG TPA: hypothetical protein VGD14_23050 [bacterium]